MPPTAPTVLQQKAPLPNPAFRLLDILFCPRTLWNFPARTSKFLPQHFAAAQDSAAKLSILGEGLPASGVQVPGDALPPVSNRRVLRTSSPPAAASTGLPVLAPAPSSMLLQLPPSFPAALALRPARPKFLAAPDPPSPIAAAAPPAFPARCANHAPATAASLPCRFANLSTSIRAPEIAPKTNPPTSSTILPNAAPPVQSPSGKLLPPLHSRFFALSPGPVSAAPQDLGES